MQLFFFPTLLIFWDYWDQSDSTDHLQSLFQSDYWALTPCWGPLLRKPHQRNTVCYIVTGCQQLPAWPSLTGIKPFHLTTEKPDSRVNKLLFNFNQCAERILVSVGKSATFRDHWHLNFQPCSIQLLSSDKFILLPLSSYKLMCTAQGHFDGSCWVRYSLISSAWPRDGSDFFVVLRYYWCILEPVWLFFRISSSHWFNQRFTVSFLEFSWDPLLSLIATVYQFTNNFFPLIIYFVRYLHPCLWHATKNPVLLILLKSTFVLLLMFDHTYID